MKKLVLMLVLTMALVTLTACGDDNDEPGKYNDSPIVGTWRGFESDYGYEQVIFYADGKGKGQEWEKKNGKFVLDDEWPIEYEYDEKAQTLTVIDTYEAEITEEDVEHFKVLSLTETTLKLQLLDDWGYGQIVTYTRVK